MKRLSISILVMSLIAAVLPISIAGAQSRNEVVTTVLYDGTDTTEAPLVDPGGSDSASGVAPEVHTPGFDAHPNNLVVRTNDQFAIRVDWNVNEDLAAGVTLTTVLPAFAEWTTDNTGGYAGCIATSFPNPQTAVCELGDQPQGSNGVIRMTAVMGVTLDNSTFDVTSTLTTDDDAAGVSDGLDQELTVSERPMVDYIKHDPQLEQLGNGDYVVLYPLSFRDYSQGTGAVGVGPIDDSAAIELADHMWNLTPNARLALETEFDQTSFSGTRCGSYDAGNGGPYVAGNGVWDCGDEYNNGTYNIVPIEVTGFTSRPAPITLADASANTTFAPQISAGQIAILLPASEVQDALDDPANGGSSAAAEMDNALVGAVSVGGPASIGSDAEIIDAIGHGTNADTSNGDPTNNNVVLSFGSPAPFIPSSPGGTYFAHHDIHWLPGPLQLGTFDEQGYPFVGFDRGTYPALTDQHPYLHYDLTTDFIGTVSRGQTITLEASSGFYSVNEGWTIASNQCIAVDTEHYNLIDLPSAIPVRQHDRAGTTAGFTSVAPSDGIAHVSQGDRMSAFLGGDGAAGVPVMYYAGGELEGWPYVIEVTNGPVATGLDGASHTGTGIAEDGLTCNGDDAGTLGWVDASGDLSDFDVVDADGNPGSDGLYEEITRIRVRALDTIFLDRNENFDAISESVGWHVYLQAQVLRDLDDNGNGQELFAFTSHTWEENTLTWDGTGDVVLNSKDGHCHPDGSLAQWDVSDPDNSSQFTNSGWCSNEFIDDGDDSSDLTDSVAYDRDTAALTLSGNVYRTSGTLVTIGGPSLDISKENNDGLSDIADNGDTVTFTIRPTIVGSDVEALTNVQVVDVLPSNYEFESMTQPTTAGASCVESAGTITCQFSDPDLSDDASSDADPLLPDGLAGGWPDNVAGDSAFEVTVTVTGAVANPDSATVLANTATVTADGLGPWDGSGGMFTGPITDASQSAEDTAYSYMPLPADEGAIVKAVDTLEGPCQLHPSIDPAPDGWGDRCSMIEFDGNMTFELTLENQGNTEFRNIRIVDVFPHNGDSAEPASFTSDPAEDPDGSTPTIGDGREPASDIAVTASLGYLTQTGDVDSVWVTAAPPSEISRDPALATSLTETAPGVPIDGAVTWCDGVGGSEVAGPTGGGCPATIYDVTATLSTFAGPVAPGASMTQTLTLDSESVECDDIWTNTFGARVDQIFLPIRSNDVSIMVKCEYDLALDKALDPAWVPAADWLTLGTSTVDFLITITNQGDPVEDFHVTDYVDTDVVSFDVADNPSWTLASPVLTTGDAALPLMWDASDPAAPVAMIDGALDAGESVFIPVTLTVEGLAAPLENWAEISYFDSDGDPSNGDSNPGNTDNPSSGALIDLDSTPDETQANDEQPDGGGDPGDGVITGDGTGFAADGTTPDPVAGDEDDHDVAGVPIYDLELVKTLTSYDMDAGTVTFEVTVTNQGRAEVFAVDVIEYPPAGLSINSVLTNAALPAGTTFDGGDLLTIAGPLAVDAAVTIPVTFNIDDIEQAPFTNTAEIAAFDNDVNDTNALPAYVVDFDSTPDTNNDDPLIDHTEPGYDPDGDGDLNEVTPGDEDDHDVAVFEPPVRIGNFVWIDADNDGVQDVGEDGVQGVVVNLLDADGFPVLDTNDDPITTTTDVDGEYFFDVTPGEYIVEFDPDSLPAGYVFTWQDSGGDDTVDSDADLVTGRTGVIDVSDPSLLSDSDADDIVDDYTWDAGITSGVQIGDYVWFDTDGDGVQDADEAGIAAVLVELLDANGAPVLDTNDDPITTTTDADGQYFFDVTPGDYQLQFNPPEGLLSTVSDAGSDDAADSDTNSFGRIATFTVEPRVNDYTLDAGFIEAQLISGVVWNDTNQDGMQDANEQVRSGVLVALFAANGDPVLDADGDPVTALTDANGYYQFPVPPGDYRLQFTAPDGTSLTPGEGSDDDADEDGFTDVISVALGVDVPGIDAGLVVSPLAVTGTNAQQLLLLGMLSIGVGAMIFGAALIRRKEQEEASTNRVSVG